MTDKMTAAIWKMNVSVLKVRLSQKRVTVIMTHRVEDQHSDSVVALVVIFILIELKILE